jgi:tetratricopeptide (TPR) repeat protein
MVLQQYVGTLATSQMEYGELTEAIANIRRGLSADLHGTVLSPAYRATRELSLGHALLLARRADEAVPPLTRGIDLASPLKDRSLAALGRADLGRALIELRRFDDAKRELDQALAGGLPATHRASVRANRHLGTLHRLRGDVAQAADALECARAASAGRPREQVEHAEVLTELALVALQRQALQSALDAASAAVATFRRVQGPATPARADALVALGRAQRALGQEPAAHASFEEALAFWRAFAPESRWAKEAAARAAAPSRQP